MYLIIWLFNFHYLPDEDDKKVDAKNEDEDEKTWKNEFDFWILHIKVKFYANFHENLRKKFLTNFVGHFWLIEAKMKMKIKKIEKQVRF